VFRRQSEPRSDQGHDKTEGLAATDAENGTVLGVDLNVDGHLAVTSSGAFIGNADYLNHKRREYEKRRGQMQQAGTRSAHLTMKSLGGRFANWSEDYLHRVSKALVQEALVHDCTHIAFEKLKHIRKRISNASNTVGHKPTKDFATT
jgi:putative transposase